MSVQCVCVPLVARQLGDCVHAYCMTQNDFMFGREQHGASWERNKNQPFA